MAVLGYSQCLRPIQVRNPQKARDIRRTQVDAFIRFNEVIDREFSFTVGCGKCINCLKKTSLEWMFRLQVENSHKAKNKTAHFVTFTYDEWNVPRAPSGTLTLNKRDMQLFYKRLRKEVKKTWDHKIKYFYCGEYGGQTKRPHYHAIIFNVPDNLDYQKIWSLGNVLPMEVNDSTIAYTTNYMLKKDLHVNIENFVNLEFKTETIRGSLTKQKTRRVLRGVNDDRQKEFRHMSKGLGDSFLSPELIAYHKENLIPYFTIQGQKKHMSRFYRDKIFDDTEKRIVSKKTFEEHTNLLNEYLEIFNYGDYRRNKETVKKSVQDAHEKRRKTLRHHAQV